MAKIDLSKGSGKWPKVREMSVKSQGNLIRILSGNPNIFYPSQMGLIRSPYNLHVSC